MASVNNNVEGDFKKLMAQPFWTAEEFAAIHKISAITARRLAYAGEVETRKIGRALRFVNTNI